MVIDILLDEQFLMFYCDEQFMMCCCAEQSKLKDYSRGVFDRLETMCEVDCHLSHEEQALMIQMVFSGFLCDFMVKTLQVFIYIKSYIKKMKTILLL